MKTIFRSFSLAIAAAVFVAAGAVSGFAQEVCADVDGQNALYTTFTDNFNKKTVAERKKAIEAGKGFLEKYGNCESVKPQADYVRPWVPKLEEIVKNQEKAEELGKFFTQFDTGIQSKNYDMAMAAGREILAREPENLNILVPLGLVGLDQSYAKNYKYNDDSLRYAKKAIELLKAGKPSTKPSGTYGAFQFDCKKEDCISQLTYSVGYINFWAKNDKVAALPFLYDAVQGPGFFKDNAVIYETIGQYYIDQAAPIGAEIAKLIAARSPQDAPEVLAQKEAEIKAKIALFNGYTERIIDAFGRAHKFTKDTARKATIYDKLKALYQQRFEKTDGLDTYLASTVSKPLPNPMTAVTPVVEAEPANTTSSPTTGSPSASVPTKPVSTVNTTKVSSRQTGSVVTPTASSTAVKAGTAVKKPVVKKKGTR